ncbi:head-tail connector protein [Roseomonas mucosa]|uniref:head-tail connector protein n=1 Tax=Roseomonas mucosa TaxID=207340 RepID=UPI00384C9F56
MRMRLVTPPADEPVTLEMARAHLRVDQTDEDTLIAAYLTAAREAVEEATGRALVTQVWEVSFDAAEVALGQPILLPKQPVTAISSVYSTFPGQAAALVDPATYMLGPGGLIALGSWPVGDLAIQFTAGYGAPGAVPRALVAAILLGLGELYESREASTAKALTENPAFRRLTNLYRIVWP